MQKFQKIISKEIEKINFPSQPNLLYQPIKYTLESGGKRLRPTLVLLGCSIFNKNIDLAIKPAIAIEIFHNFTLLHDDIMDNSSIRRKKPTVHKEWNSNIAILSGDAMQIIAYNYITELPADKLKLVLKIFNKIAIQVCEGQQFDMNFETQNNVSIAEYIEMIRLKTSVLLAGALKIGAIIGGASETNSDLLYQYAENIGLAFQLQDDLLDTYGNTEVFGKKIGNDILTNKKTFLLINAMQLADNQTNKQIQNLISNNNIEAEQKILEMISIFNKLNIKQITENKIKYYFEKAFTFLNKIDINAAQKQQLKDFADLLMDRKY